MDRTEELPPPERAARLDAWSRRFLSGLDGAPVDDPLLPAVLHTIEVFGLDRGDFAAFLRSMAMDLTVTDYPDYPALLDYMEGSAAVIGTMMLPILEPRDAGRAREPARQLGLAFQLTNFIRDVAEDYRRGRVYLPAADLQRFGVDRESIGRAVERRRTDPALRDLIRYEVARARLHYAAAAPGVPMLTGASQACIRTAYHLYSAILTEVERAGYDVFARRAVVAPRQRLRLAVGCLLTRPGTPVAIPAGPP